MGQQKDGPKKDGGEKKSGGGDAPSAPPAVVLKVDIHCDRCAKKVKKLVASFSGVDDVNIDAAGNKLTVTGKMDPAKLRQRLEDKIHKKVELVSPQPPKKDGGAAAEKKPEEKKVEDKKPVESTVVLKINIHCDGCNKKIRKAICKIKGVDSISIDPSKDLVTIKGTMDAKELAPFLQAKLKRAIEVVQPKKDAAATGGDKKDKEYAAADKKPDGGGDKAKAGEVKKDVAAGGPPKVEVSKMEHLGYYMNMAPWHSAIAHGEGYGSYHVAVPYQYHGAHPSQGGYYPPAPYGYTTADHRGVAQAPHMFSDENPNACSVM
ncbi:hypothetical protein SAY86_005728 [Trapa natans]|uniref:HMA domain-containing protein n=1 Tax=Trapa natans TaxID=22666 RepID=A0AAN7L8I2_TRANT|nr:hypothetical protein SAY86_005728 [Trapa natans]